MKQINVNSRIASLFGLMQKYRKPVIVASIAYMALAGTYVLLNQPAYGQFQAPKDAQITSYTNEDLELLAQTMTCEYPQAIVSESMEPELKVGETVIVDYCFPISELEVGDIIVFEADSVEKFKDNEIYQYNVDLGLDVMLVMHRIIDITHFEDDSYTLIAKGDNNPDVIEGVEDDIDSKEYLGKVIKKKEVVA